MHPYTVDNNERIQIASFLVIPSIVIIYIVQMGLNNVAISVPWFISVPSICGIYGISWYLFDNYLWKIPFLHSVGLIKTPNLSGKWSGYLRSSHEKYQTEYKIRLEIHQNWTSISLNMRANSSCSKSIEASMNLQDPEQTKITYQYLNDPLLNTPESMHMHRGTTTLGYDASTKTLEGDYYTDGKRKNTGTIYLEREK